MTDDLPIGDGDWPRVLGLLDHLLALPDVDRLGALEALGGGDARLRGVLRGLLDLRAGIHAEHFLETIALASVKGAADVAPAQVGPWRVLRELGRGGMSVVHLVERSDAPGLPPVALKLPLLDPASASTLVARFERERDILASLDHPGIVRVRDAGVSDGRPWLAMDFVDGEPIVEYAQRRGCSIRERIGLVLQALEALAHAHAQLVIHRDIKPANVLVDRTGRVRLLDFGVAKVLDDPAGGSARDSALTAFGGRAMTPRYASPEQIAGGTLGTATDIYSMGVLLYELLTGSLPYAPATDTAHAWERAVVDGAVRPPSRVVDSPTLARALRGDLDAILTKCLALRPADRYPSSAALADDLQRHLSSRPVQARGVGRLYLAGRHLRRNALGWSAGAALGLALTAGLLGTLWQARAARAEAERANAVQRFVLDIFRHNSLRQADPQRARETPARELLSIGSANLERSLGANPAAKEPVIEVLAQMHSDIGLTDRAVALRREAVVLAEQLHGPLSVELADALAQLGAELHHAGQLGERRQALERGLAIVQALPDRPSAARVKVYVGWSALEQSGNHAQAVDWADRAAADAQRLDDATLQVQAFEAAAAARYVAGDAAGGVHWSQRVLATAEQCGCLFPGELLRTRVQLAEGQALLMQPAAAVRTLQSARLEAERLGGPQHLDTVQVTIRLALTLQLHGRFDEALALLEPLRSLVDPAAGGADEFNAPQVYNGLGGTLSGLGRHDEAIAATRRGIELRDRSRANTPYAATLRETLVRVLIAAGRLDDAAQALADADRVHRAYGAQPGDRRRGRLLALEVRWHLARGDGASALRGLAALGPAPDLSERPSLRGLDDMLLRAEVELATGQSVAARPRLAAVRQLLDRDGLAAAMPRVRAELTRLCAQAGAGC